MHLANGTFLLVCDASKALLLQNHGDAERIDLRVVEVLGIDNPPDREQSSDRPGRFQTPAGGKAATDETDQHEAAESRFAEETAELVRSALKADASAKLILAADPRSLGRLRPLLNQKGITDETILAEINKDLSHHPVPEIERLITAY